MTASWTNVLFAAIGALIAFTFLRTWVKGTNVRAQLAAKDDAIKTNEQTIASLTKRVEELERLEEQRELRVVKLEEELLAAKARYATLEPFAAPRALLRVLLVLENQDLKLNALIDKSLTALEQQALSQKLQTRQTIRHRESDPA